MKKTLWIALILMLVCILSFSACDDSEQTKTQNSGHVHTFSEWTTVKDATCAVKGEQERSCSCGEKESKSIDATGHTEVVDIAVAATCTTDGKTEGKHCSVCNETLVAQNTISASHTDGDWVIDTNATCTEDGSKHQICSVCTTTIKTEVIPTKGHAYGEWIIDREATKSEDGKRHAGCSMCSARIEEIIHATGSIGLSYSANYDNMSCTITGIGTCEDNEIIIPASIDGYIVTKIGEEAFAVNNSITFVKIPDTVTTIGAGAFYQCSEITEFIIPNSVINICSSAFYNCSSLAYITFLNSVTSIGKDAFYKCSNLEDVYITDLASWCQISFDNYASNPLYYSNNLYLLENGEKKLITELVIPNSVRHIGDYAFNSYDRLTSVTIPNSVTSIGYSTFESCTGLMRLTIPNSVTNIGKRAFAYCSSLVNIAVEGGVTIIDASAFAYCSSLTNIIIPDSVVNIGANAFLSCSSLASVTIGSNVTSIGSAAFSNCKSLTSVTIPDSVTSIDSSAFEGCLELTSVIIGSGVKSIDFFVFKSCNNLTSVVFKNTKGWWYSPHTNATSGTSISSYHLADPATAAKLLTSTYVWKFLGCSQ